MIILFILVFLDGENSIVMPHTYKTEEACRQSAYAHRADFERFACVKLTVEEDD